jgi:DHA2 family multidrug resistance protein
MRNLGGAVGIALVNTWLLAFFQRHLMGLVQSAGRAPDGALKALAGLSQLFGVEGVAPDRGRLMAAATLARGISAQALALAFADVFGFCAWIFAACLLLTPFCRPGPMTEARRHEDAQESA